MSNHPNRSNKISEQLRLAKEIAGDRCTVKLHHGAGSARAIRITGCFPEQAADVGREIEAALQATGNQYAGFRLAAGFAAVWIS